MFNEGDTQQSSTDKPVALEFPIELEFGNVGFWGRRKIGEPGEKPSEQGREPTTNPIIHIWRRVRESNPGHIGGRPSLRHTAPPLLEAVTCHSIRVRKSLIFDRLFGTPVITSSECSQSPVFEWDRYMEFLACTVTQRKNKSQTIQWMKLRNWEVIGET